MSKLLDISDQMGSPNSKSPANSSPAEPGSTGRLSRSLRLRPRKGKGASDETPPSSAHTPPSVLRRRKFVYTAAVKQAARGWLGRREKFAQLLGRNRRPDYYKPIKVSNPGLSLAKFSKVPGLTVQ